MLLCDNDWSILHDVWQSQVGCQSKNNNSFQIPLGGLTRFPGHCPSTRYRSYSSVSFFTLHICVHVICDETKTSYYMTYESVIASQFLHGKTFCRPTVIRLFVIRKVCPDDVRLIGQVRPCLIHSATRIPWGVIHFLKTRFFKKTNERYGRKRVEVCRVENGHLPKDNSIHKGSECMRCVVFNSTYCLLMLTHRFKRHPIGYIIT